MKKNSYYVCQQCGDAFAKWSGKCGSCHAWNSLVESVMPKSSTKRSKLSFGSDSQLTKLSEIPLVGFSRIHTGIEDLDRVLGGGIIPGMAMLIGGDPGIGKSTLLSQVLGILGKTQNVLYVTGEESLEQVSIRMDRLRLDAEKMFVLAETSVEKMIEQIIKSKSKVVVIDSIQTTFSENLSSASGSVSQIRETASMLIQLAKQKRIALFIVGHVTKEGVLAGPRLLEHMVDTVLYFEGDKNNRYRLLRSVKNRFGPVNELGVFIMNDKGLQTVTNPSAIFLAQFDQKKSGNMITAMWEGTRPILVEVQALVDHSYLANPRRVAVGIDNNRLAILLAVLNRHVNIATFDKDVYINIVGGLKVTETAVDLAIALAIYSSLSRKAINDKILTIGEVGLSGEIRPVQYGVDRLSEAAKLGFTKAIIASKNKPKKPIANLEVKSVESLQEALDVFQKVATDEVIA